MTIRKKSQHSAERVIDLTGPDGNAFFLLGYARRLGRELDWSPQEMDAVIADMMSGDYEHLVRVFDDNFGKFITLLR